MSLIDSGEENILLWRLGEIFQLDLSLIASYLAAHDLECRIDKVQ